ncbi:hypothetical protein CYMTET_50639, partial [Cymbomonas tetramitiformis]
SPAEVATGDRGHRGAVTGDRGGSYAQVTAELLEKKAERARLQQERDLQRDNRIFMRGVERDKSLKSRRLVEEKSLQLSRKREMGIVVVERENLRAQAEYTQKIIQEKAASKNIEQQQLDEKKRLYMYKKHQLKYQQLERSQERKEKEEVQAKREEAIARKIRLRELREVERIVEVKKQGKAEAAERLLEKERRASASRYAERMRQEDLEDLHHAKQELETQRAAGVQEAELRQAEHLLAVDKAPAEAAAQLRAEADELAQSAQEMASIRAEALALEKKQSREAKAAAQELSARRAESIATLEAQHEADSMNSYLTARSKAEERSELEVQKQHEQTLEKELAAKLALQELERKKEEESEREESRRRAIEELEDAREVRATQWAHDQHALAKHQVA